MRSVLPVYNCLCKEFFVGEKTICEIRILSILLHGRIHVHIRLKLTLINLYANSSEFLTAEVFKYVLKFCA